MIITLKVGPEIREVFNVSRSTRIKSLSIVVARRLKIPVDKVHLLSSTNELLREWKCLADYPEVEISRVIYLYLPSDSLDRTTITLYDSVFILLSLRFGREAARFLAFEFFVDFKEPDFFLKSKAIHQLVERVQNRRTF